MKLYDLENTLEILHGKVKSTVDAEDVAFWTRSFKDFVTAMSIYEDLQKKIRDNGAKAPTGNPGMTR